MTRGPRGSLLNESALPIDPPPFAGACDLLGIDPLYVAETRQARGGSFPQGKPDAALEALRKPCLGSMQP